MSFVRTAALLKPYVSTEEVKGLTIAQLLQQIQQLQNSLPPQIQVHFWSDVIFEDALGRLAPSRLEWINTWNVFLALLETQFKGIRQRKIKRKEFILHNTSTGREITFETLLEVSIRPRQQVTMIVAFTRRAGINPETVCPYCHAAYDGSVDEETEWYVTTPELFSMTDCESPCCNRRFLIQQHSDIFAASRYDMSAANATFNAQASKLDFRRVLLHGVEFYEDILPPPYALEDVAISRM